MTWKVHTSTEEFKDGITAIAQKYEADNNIRTAKVEEFIIEEAIRAGVLKATKKRIAWNPNKWPKHMAPWFNEQCKTARTRYRAAA